jgi:hypothetical protein
VQAAGEDVARSEGAVGNSYILHSVTVLLDIVRLQSVDMRGQTTTKNPSGWNDPADFLGAKARQNRGRSSPTQWFACAQIECSAVCKFF